MSSAPASAPRKIPYRLLGKSGLKVSLLSFGSWVTFKYQVGTDSAYDLMKLAYESGVNFFDNAEVYAHGESERIMGEAIQKGIEKGDWERCDLVICTKIFFGTKDGVNNRGLTRKHMIEGTRASLKRLQLSYVDLLLCHRPDPLTPIEETVRAANFLIDQGLTFYWGTSEWSAEQLREATEIAHRLNMVPPLLDQTQYNIYERQRVEIEYAGLFRDYKLGITSWSPLASGILTGKYSGFKIPESSRLALPDYAWLKNAKFAEENKWQIEKADALVPVAKEVGCTLSQLAIAWCCKNKNISTVILGATNCNQLKENLESVQFLDKLTPEIMARIDTIVGPMTKYNNIEKQVRGLRDAADFE